ncbi:sugar transferase [Tessaracoccus oleiagri]|uniref:Sugar transferase involved in LPS biosynthesis (Colanic, teichoic acid) n=1 Tax=Tessaracoccus oleiagri TaxID=686624 RepID=A0A1G9KG48_9ACTN|nr:sugar transferase [Tessaracoccus oleiagri]SDL48494.1 Sugar transferase involved in LPS biosynthesis (colanic, teichoic acid) [Tessaracoccus oleiagri]
MSLYRRYGKRILDLALGVVALPLVGAAALVVVPAIRLEDGGPALYRSQRRGLRGRHFTMLKFRSMGVGAPDLRNADLSTLNSDDDPRVTRVGRIIRKLSVDELPQVLNVLRGDMSFVGPRPNMTRQSWDELTEQERKRVQVRPGITGLSQAYHRNAATTQQKYALDCEYVDTVSLLLDLKIIAKTFTSVLAARNINASGTAGEGERS